MSENMDKCYVVVRKSYSDVNLLAAWHNKKDAISFVKEACEMAKKSFISSGIKPSRILCESNEDYTELYVEGTMQYINWTIEEMALQ